MGGLEEKKEGGEERERMWGCNYPSGGYYIIFLFVHIFVYVFVKLSQCLHEVESADVLCLNPSAAPELGDNTDKASRHQRFTQDQEIFPWN